MNEVIEINNVELKGNLPILTLNEDMSVIENAVIKNI